MSDLNERIVESFGPPRCFNRHAYCWNNRVKGRITDVLSIYAYEQGQNGLEFWAWWHSIEPTARHFRSNVLLDRLYVAHARGQQARRKASA